MVAAGAQAQPVAHVAVPRAAAAAPVRSRRVTGRTPHAVLPRRRRDRAAADAAPARDPRAARPEVRGLPARADRRPARRGRSARDEAGPRGSTTPPDRSATCSASPRSAATRPGADRLGVTGTYWVRSGRAGFAAAGRRSLLPAGALHRSVRQRSRPSSMTTAGLFVRLDGGRGRQHGRGRGVRLPRAVAPCPDRRERQPQRAGVRHPRTGRRGGEQGQAPRRALGGRRPRRTRARRPRSGAGDGRRLRHRRHPGRRARPARGWATPACASSTTSATTATRSGGPSGDRSPASAARSPGSCTPAGSPPTRRARSRSRSNAPTARARCS